MEKRINILFDHLNNEDLLTEETVGQVRSISAAIQGREWDVALKEFNDMQAAKGDEGRDWMVSFPVLPNVGEIVTSC